MTIFSSLLVSSSDNMIPFAVLGGVALILLAAFFVGLKQGFSGIKRRPLSWAFGCAVFALLELFCHEMVASVLGGAIGGMIATVAFLAVSLLLRFIVFAGMEKAFNKKFDGQLAKAESVRVEEMATGEFVAFDENKLQKHIPYDGKEKPCAINRFFGGIFSVVIVAIVLCTLAAVALLVVGVTPFAESLAYLFENATFVTVFVFVRTYTLDFVLIAIIVGVIRQGYKSGFFAVIRSLVIFVLRIGVIAFAFYIPFSGLIAEGQPFHFVGKLVEYFGGMLFGVLPAEMPIAIPEDVIYGVVKVGLGIVLSIIFTLLSKLITWILNKIQDAVDESDAACVVDGVFGAILYFVFGLLLVAVICVIMYLLTYYNVFDTTVFFMENSPLVGGFFRLFDELVKPLLETMGSALGL